MRRILIALMLVAASAFMAAPAMADEGTGSETPATSEPAPQEESPSPPAQEESPAPQEETPSPEATETPGTVEQTPDSGGQSGGSGNQSSGSGEQSTGSGEQTAGSGPTTDSLPPGAPTTTDLLKVTDLIQIFAKKKTKITICHATSSPDNPYVSNQPDASGDLNGHAGHSDDIIPPFDFDEGGHFNGQNWDAEGQAIYNNGCNVPSGPPDPEEPGEIALCHATGTDTYDSVSATANATAGGHDSDADDIIPPFALDPGPGNYAGKNFDADGEAIFNNGCVVPSGPVDPEEQKITICHANSAEDNPYVENNPNANGDVSGHAGHANDGVWYPGAKADGFNWGDIIPPFDYGNGQHFDGVNWTAAGQAIYNNGCKPVGTPPDPEEGEILICHATSDEKMPYVQNSPSANGTVDGHAGHIGDGVWYPGAKDDGFNWGDIIPPFDYGNGLHFDGLNWNADGQAIWENGCVPTDDPGEHCEDDCDEDDEDGDDPDKAALLPDTGGTSLWTLLMGGLLSVLGMAILSNRGSMGRVGLFDPLQDTTHWMTWSMTTGTAEARHRSSARSHRGRWSAVGALALLGAIVVGRHAKR